METKHMKTTRKRLKKTGDYVIFPVRFEPLIKEMLTKASEKEGVSLTKYIADAAFNRMANSPAERAITHER